MRKVLAVFLCVLTGCAHIEPNLREFTFTTERPPATVEEAIRTAPPLIEDESAINDLPYAEPTPLRLGQAAPNPGVLISEYDAGRYRLLDENGETWRLRAITAQWQLARTEYRDAELVEALQDRIRFTERQSRRRRSMLWLVLGAGAVLGIGTTLGVRGLLR